jgi:hypothetical protein
MPALAIDPWLDGLQAITNLLGVVAWPFVALVVFLSLREPVAWGAPS